MGGERSGRFVEGEEGLLGGLMDPVYNNPMQQQQGFRRNTDQMYPPYSTGQQQNS